MGSLLGSGTRWESHVGTALETQPGLRILFSGSPLALLPQDLKRGCYTERLELWAGHLGRRGMALNPSQLGLALDTLFS